MGKKINEMLKKVFSEPGVARWGVDDLSDEARDALIAAIRSGENFNTGVYTVTKEIESGRVKRVGDTITCEAEVGNDFNEEGAGESSFTVRRNMHPDRVVSMIQDHLKWASEQAYAEQNTANKLVRLYTIEIDGTYAVEYLQDVSNYGLSEPPGDYFREWGFQIDPDEGNPLPDDVKEIIEYRILELCGGTRREMTFEHEGRTYKIAEVD